MKSYESRYLRGTFIALFRVAALSSPLSCTRFIRLAANSRKGRSSSELSLELSVRSLASFSRACCTGARCVSGCFVDFALFVLADLFSLEVRLRLSVSSSGWLCGRTKDDVTDNGTMEVPVLVRPFVNSASAYAYHVYIYKCMGKGGVRHAQCVRGFITQEYHSLLSPVVLCPHFAPSNAS